MGVKPQNHTLPGRDYHSAEVFEAERERVFHAIGSTSGAPRHCRNRAIS